MRLLSEILIQQSLKPMLIKAKAAEDIAALVESLLG